jgi:hypothetical protein
MGHASGPDQGPTMEFPLSLEAVQGARATREPGRPTPPVQAKAKALVACSPGEVGAEAARSLDGRGRGFGRRCAYRLVWLGSITHAKARSESCPPCEALGVRCLEDRPALLGLGVRGRERSGGSRDRRGRGLARGPDGIRATLTLIAAYRDQARGYQARSSRPRGLVAVFGPKGPVGTDLGPWKFPDGVRAQRPGNARTRSPDRPARGGGVSHVRGAAGPSGYLGL